MTASILDRYLSWMSPSFVESYFDRLWLTAGNLFASPEI